jgi:hypothetical protein
MTAVADMKTAVFQVNEEDGAAYLVCVRMSGLRAACALEQWLRNNAGDGKEIRLLGRFDAVHAAIGQHEAKSLILGDGQCGAGAVFTVEELVNRVLLRPAF